MRIDKFLWCIRLYKTRNLSAEACKKNKVWVNEVLAKASKEIMISDTIKIRKDQINYTFEVIQIPASRISAKNISLYRIDKTDKEEIERREKIKSDQAYYRNKGVGRPTKKDRREIEGFVNSEEE